MNLREIRFYKNLSQQVVAIRAEMHQSTFCNLERGYKKPTTEQKRKIAKALNIEPAAIDWEMVP